MTSQRQQQSSHPPILGLRHPLRLTKTSRLLLAAIVLFRSVISVLAAWSIADLIRGSMTSHGFSPADMYANRGLLLVEIVRLHLPAFHSLALQAMLIMILVVPIHVSLDASLLVALSQPRRPTNSVLAAIWAATGRMLSLFAGYAAVLAISLGFISAVWPSMMRYALTSWGLPGRHAMLALLLGISIFAITGITAIFGVANATVVRQGAPALDALLDASQRWARHPITFTMAYASRLSLAIFVLVETEQIHAVFLSHQGIFVLIGAHLTLNTGLALIHLSWLRRTLLFARPRLIQHADD